MPNRRIIYMPLDEIVPADVNPKDHDEEVIAGSIGRFGFIEPAVLDERTGKLVAGHGRSDELRRRQAAGEKAPEGVQVKGGRWLVPVVRGWSSRTDDEAHAAGIALNRAGEKGGWKTDVLFDLLDRFAQQEDGLVGLGFDSADIDDLLATAQERELAYDPNESYGGGDTSHAEPGIEARAQKYSGKGIRSLVLDYKLDDYDEVAATCARLRRHRGLDTNAELVQSLVLAAAKEIPADALVE